MDDFSDGSNISFGSLNDYVFGNVKFSLAKNFILLHLSC